MRRIETALLALALAAAFSAAALAADGAATSCTLCHASDEWFDEDRRAIVDLHSESVHATRDISCHHCHGGNPDPALAGDMAAAMDEGWSANPYRGSPARGDVPLFCGRCHSDLQFMRRFNPSARVDQVAEYWTSRHGQGLRQGDANVATCNDCHGTHDIRRPTDPHSRVYPTSVAETCGGCHSDLERMGAYRLAGGRALPIDQHAKWKRSVHAAAMFEKADLTAPTCNDCHGNHGALPPGLESIGFVCGQCHGREADLFRQSPKHAGFESHNAFLEGEACSSCHDEISTVAVSFDHFSECATCHDHHGVVRPTVALLGPLPQTPCVFCHEPDLEQSSGIVAERPRALDNYVRTRDSLLEAAQSQGLDGDARFDWLVDQALVLPNHVLATDESAGQTAILRPEFARLFEKFRIGKTHYTYADPATGNEVAAPIIRCNDCHKDPDGAGLRAAADMLTRMRLLTGLTARAERNLLAARRGGVEVRTAREHLDGAVDSQIELEVLVHTFAVEGRFEEKHVEGMGFATAALEAGRASLGELTYRRRGLAVALGIVLLVLVALGLKIRSIS